MLLLLRRLALLTAGPWSTLATLRQHIQSLRNERVALQRSLGANVVAYLNVGQGNGLSL